MSIKFERHAFLEFFDNMTVIEEQAAIFEYSIVLKEGYTLILYVNTYEERVIITLKNEKLEISLYSIQIDSIIKIGLKSEKERRHLCFFKEPNDKFLHQDMELQLPFFALMVKPSVHFELSL